MYYHIGLTNINILPCLPQISPDITTDFQLVCILCILPCMLFIFIAHLQIHKEDGTVLCIFIFYINDFICYPFAVCLFFIQHCF